VSLYDAVKDLAFTVEGYDLEIRSLDVSSDFTRKTTTIRLLGAGEEGLGEDVTYDAAAHDAQLERGSIHELAGEGTLESFSGRVGDLPLFEEEPQMAAFHDYRRWAFESAALDLALRQNGISLADAVGRELRPLTYVVSVSRPRSTA
jgi:hypothetical protein